jgi:1,4-alpha-glucan branching enzyme
MKSNLTLSIIIHAHHPFVPAEEKRISAGEQIFFEALSETYIPLLMLFDVLEQDEVPFRLSMVLSPTLCSMLHDKKRMEKYVGWLDRRIAFGDEELKRCGSRAELPLAEFYRGQDLERRAFFTERCGMNLLEAFDSFRKKGRLEFLASSATHAFLPFYVSMEEALRAQIETAVVHHRRYLRKNAAGFWLPELGWTGALGPYLRDYHFTYTVVDAHALVLGSPPARGGSFCPVKTPSGLMVFARDITAHKDLANLVSSRAGVYQASFLDAGYELSVRALKPLLGPENYRCSTGYRYRTGNGTGHILYDPRKAREAAGEDALRFLQLRLARLKQAQSCLETDPVSVWAFDAGDLGRSWYEGTAFLEALIREIAREKSCTLLSPQDYLDSPGSFIKMNETVTEPDFSSSLPDGYGGILLDASNDWIYRHIFRSVQRMVEMTGRFPGDTGLKERALNQAARELLLAQSTDWAKPVNPQWQDTIDHQYAAEELEGALRNFTTIYEALGSNHISTEWLTALEKRHALLPCINYRVFGKKK